MRNCNHYNWNQLHAFHRHSMTRAKQALRGMDVGVLATASIPSTTRFRARAGRGLYGYTCVVAGSSATLRSLLCSHNALVLSMHVTRLHAATMSPCAHLLPPPGCWAAHGYRPPQGGPLPRGTQGAAPCCLLTPEGLPPPARHYMPPPRCLLPPVEQVAQVLLLLLLRPRAPRTPVLLLSQ